jgi:hypothetical protein
LADWLAVWQSSRVLAGALREQKQCIRDVHAIARDLVVTPPDVPPDYQVSIAPLPKDALEVKRNLFSTLFLAMYHVLGVPPDRRLLFGKLNQLFRVWVTAADNLLDAEDKVVLPLHLPHDARTMREVVAIMTADRILATLLNRAVDAATITRQQADEIAARSLQSLLGSAGQEASEESGVTDRPRPEEVLHTIHRLKTGLLFHIPFVGSDATGESRTPLGEDLKRHLLDFGLGCQLLDDIRDLATDLCEGRHNYLLSRLRWQQPEAYAGLVTRDDCKPGDRLYREFPELARDVAAKAHGMLHEAMASVSALGLALRPGDPARIAQAMFQALDLADVMEQLDV